MQKSLQIVLCQEVNQEPFWRANYVEVDENGNGKNCVASFKLDTSNANTIDSLISIIRLYKPNASPDELSQAKARKLSELEENFNTKLKQGWDSGRGRLGMTAEDVALLSGAFALAKEAANLNLPLPQLVALNDSLISFETIGEMTQFMLGYGAARSTLSIQYANLRQLVESATTLEAVYNVSPV